MKAMRIFIFGFFVFLASLTACSFIKPERPIPGIDESLIIEDVRVALIDARIQNSYSTHYIMHYPKEGDVFCVLHIDITGFNDPAEAVAWGNNKFRLIYNDQVGDLEYSSWSILGDDIEYSAEAAFDYRYVFIYSLPISVEPTRLYLYLSDNQLVPLASILEPGSLNGKVSVREDVGGKTDSTQTDMETTTGQGAVVSGGSQNIASAYHGTVSGGYLNMAYTAYATICGGRENQVNGHYGSIGGGYANLVNSRDGTVAGGSRNSAAGYHSTVAGGIRNQAIGSDTTVSGGSYNKAGDLYATVCGGTQNGAIGSGSVVGGGSGNFAGGEQAVVSGGLGNSSSGIYAVIGGGQGNSNSGSYSTIPGGSRNQVNADFAFGAGHRVLIETEHTGTFLYADSTEQDFHSERLNEFAVRATGGVRFVTGVGASGEAIAGTYLPPGSGSWATLSDRAMKKNIQPVNPHQILDSVLSLPVSRWSYAAQQDDIWHIGPMAQDFYAAFGVGEDEKHISNVDMDGVMLAAIQALHQRLEDREDRVFSLEQDISRLERRLNVQNAILVGFVIVFVLKKIKKGSLN